MRLRGLLLGCLLPVVVACLPSVAHAQRMHCRPNFLRLDECAGPGFNASRERVRTHAFENAIRTETRRIAAAERADRQRVAVENRTRERIIRNDLARTANSRVRVRIPRVRIREQHW